ncbi:MAG: DUF3352 domain-containing protein [Cyanobacteria bacterium]|nr:DUF3352 domain-containing protein [Cyanobacteriota bacterium]
MKARPFLAVVLAAVLLLLSLAAAGWWLVLQRSPLQLQHQPLVSPRAARFVPRQAPLSLYLLTDGQRPEGYARAVAPGRQRRQAADAVAGLRDGAFAAAGLDYPAELASWLGPELGLALLANEPGGAADGWLLSLRSRDADGARRFLQRFWQTRSLAGTDLQISSYRGMGLISGRGALVGTTPVPIATALVNDDLVLIASGRGVLEQALDVSQIDELNQAASPSFQQALGRLGKGAVLLTAQAEVLGSWLGMPAQLTGAGAVQELVASLRPDGRSLALEALLRLAPGAASPPPAPPAAAGDAGLALLAALQGQSDSLALVQQPSHWPELWQPLLAAVLRVGEGGGDGLLPALVAVADPGPLLWSAGSQGWLLGTAVDQPDPASLEQGLAAQGLTAAPLPVEGDASVMVWTRLEAPPAGRRIGREEGAVLQASLAGARTSQGQLAWWGQNLAVLQEQRESRQTPRLRLAQLAALDQPQASLQWATAAGPAQALLQRWSTWQLLSGLAGRPLAPAVQGLSLSLEPGDSNSESNSRTVHLSARVGFG